MQLRKLLPAGQRPFRPTVLIDPRASGTGLITQYVNPTVSVTGFYFPPYAYRPAFGNPQPFRGDPITPIWRYAYLPALEEYAKRAEYTPSFISADTAGFDWFIKLFKYYVYPQVVAVDRLYEKNSTQHNLLSNLAIFFKDAHRPDPKSLLFQAKQFPSPVVGVEATVVFTHDGFSKWIHGALMEGISMSLLIQIAKTMFGTGDCSMVADVTEADVPSVALVRYPDVKGAA